MVLNLTQERLVSCSSGPANLCVDGKIGGSNGEGRPSLSSGGCGVKGMKVTLGMPLTLGKTLLPGCWKAGLTPPTATLLESNPQREHISV